MGEFFGAVLQKAEPLLLGLPKVLYDSRRVAVMCSECADVSRQYKCVCTEIYNASIVKTIKIELQEHLHNFL